MTNDLVLSLDEARVLGVLIEKSMTTPEQYPLSLNALMNGCNQKSNRSPVLSMDTSDIRDALRGLREKQLAVEIWPSGGSRTEKFRHLAQTALGLDDRNVAVIAELLLRRAQMPGEVRARASRMALIDSQGDLHQILDALMAKGMVVQLAPAPAPGSRSERYDHSLCADAGSTPEIPHELPSATPSPQESKPAIADASRATTAKEQSEPLLVRLQALEARVKTLEERLS